jgi:hypothetical protein
MEVEYGLQHQQTTQRQQTHFSATENIVQNNNNFSDEFAMRTDEEDISSCIEVIPSPFGDGVGETGDR